MEAPVVVVPVPTVVVAPGAAGAAGAGGAGAAGGGAAVLQNKCCNSIQKIFFQLKIQGVFFTGTPPVLSVRSH